MFGAMLPRGTGKVKLSTVNMAGMGTAMMKFLMKKKHVASLEEMLEVAGELGVKIYICQMTMDLMGFKREEMIDYPKLFVCGVATFLEEANNDAPVKSPYPEIYIQHMVIDLSQYYYI